MPIGSIPTSSTSYPFILRIGPKVMTGASPVGDGVMSCSITESAEGSPNRMSFAIEDPDLSVTFDGGEEVELVDRRSGSERLLFGGHLVEWTSAVRDSGIGRIWECEALGFDAWLDWRVVPSWTSKTNKNGRVTRITSDRAMVQQLINRYGAAITAPDSTVSATNTSMEVVSLRKMTLREALTRVAESAMYADTELNRFFYVDNAKRLHYYRGSEDLTAPYRIADGSYIRDVVNTSGLVAYWPMSASGTTMWDANGYANGTLTGTATTGIEGGVVNEPSYRAVDFDGSSGYMTATGANLHPGDTFSVEFWCRRGSTGAYGAVWSGGTDDVEIGFTSSDYLYVAKQGTGDNFQSTDTYTSTTAWLHVMVTRSPGSTDVYVDGEAISGTTTARTFSAAAGAINVGRRTAADRYFDGAVQHVAVYSTKKSAATALAHYSQGVSVTPQNLRVTRSAFDGREEVYVAGSKPDGTGFVRNPSLVRTAFGTPGRQPARQEIIDRDDSEGPTKRRTYGRWFLRSQRDPRLSLSFQVVGYDGWRVGQRVYVTSTAHGLSATDTEVKEITTDVGFGNGVLTYDIQCGRPTWSGVRAVARGNKRG